MKILANDGPYRPAGLHFADGHAPKRLADVFEQDETVGSGVVAGPELLVPAHRREHPLWFDRRRLEREPGGAEQVLVQAHEVAAELLAGEEGGGDHTGGDGLAV